MTTSFSAAPLQMGNDCDRQKARLHWLQEAEAWARRPARGSMIGSGEGSCRSGNRLSRSGSDASLSSGAAEAVGSGAGAEAEVDVELEVLSASGGGSLTWDEGLELVDWCLISIIVLLLKQVHLQKVGAAVAAWSVSRGMREPRGGEQAHLRRPPARRAPLEEGQVC